METKKLFKTVKLQLPIFIGILILFSAISFFAGYKISAKSSPPQSAKITFAPSKSDRPELKFFVMSFCPYGNLIEDVLRPVFDLVGSKATIQPQYIFEKINNLTTYCQTRFGDINKCPDYIKGGYFKTEDECKKTITATYASQNYKDCLDDKTYIKSPSGDYYTSLHGRIEANQDIREICAWNLTSDKKPWWAFIDNVNKNCNAQNADTCWEEQAKKANLDTAKISECFNKDGIALMDKEIDLTTKYKVQGSPTLILNDTVFPPEEAYVQDGSGSIKIGNTIYQQKSFRSSDFVKAAVCASFNRAPSECKKVLPEPQAAAGSGAAAAAGNAGCAN